MCALLFVHCGIYTLSCPSKLFGQKTVTKEYLCSPVQTDSTIQEEPWFGKDKAYHVVGSFGIVCAGTLIHGQHYNNGLGQDIRFGIGLALTLGLTKEIIDEVFLGRRFSGKDLIADIVGTLLGVLFISMI